MEGIISVDLPRAARHTLLIVARTGGDKLTQALKQFGTLGNFEELDGSGVGKVEKKFLI